MCNYVNINLLKEVKESNLILNQSGFAGSYVYKYASIYVIISYIIINIYLDSFTQFRY